MRYITAEDMLHLENDAKVWKNEDTITGEHIQYDAKQGQITAKGRVNMVISPTQIKEKE